MRTTLTLDADIARRLKADVRLRKMSFKEAVNNALRAGLGMNTTSTTRAPFVVITHRGGFKPGIDPHKLNKLVVDLEDEAVVNRARSQ